VRVPGAELVGDSGIVLGALVLVADEKADRGAGGAAFVDARKNFDRVGFAPLRDVARRARLSPIQFLLDIAGGELQSRRAAVDHAAVRGPVRLAERRDAVEKPERVAGHGRAILHASLEEAPRLEYARREALA